MGLALVGVVTVGLVAAALNLPTPAAQPRTPTVAVSPTPEPVEHRAVFIGDSYTQGTGATSQGSKWAALVSAELDLLQVNLGRGGTGYVATSDVNGCGLEYCPSYPEMVPDAVAKNPAVVFVAGGQNDLTSWGKNPASVRAAISATFQALRAGLPDALIVGVGPSVPNGAGESVAGLDAAVRDAVAAVGGTYVSLLEPAVIEPAMVLPDGAHVNDSGHLSIANRIVPAVEPQVTAAVQG